MLKIDKQTIGKENTSENNVRYLRERKICMKKIIDFALEQELKNDELGTVERLRDTITEIIRKFGNITNVTVKKYIAKPDAKYEFKISISTVLITSNPINLL